MERMAEIDVVAERQKVLSQARNIKAMMNNMLENSYFQHYAEELKKQYEERLPQLFQMPVSADDVVARTYVAGELAGLKIAIDLPAVLIDFAQASIDQAALYEEHDKEAEQPMEIDDAEE